MRESVNKSLLRAISIVTSFTPNDVELSLSEISRKTGIPLTTVHRIVTTLAQGGLLEQAMHNNKYRIGPEFYILGNLYLRRTDMLSAAEPVIKELSSLTGETSAVAVPHECNVVLILKEEAKLPFRIVNHVGSILVAYTSAMGKALLSELSEAEIDRIIPEERLNPMTKNTIPTKTELKKDLEQIRKTGISFDIEGNFDGVVGIASVIRDASGKAVAAMTIGLAAFRAGEAYRSRIATLVKMGASLISYRLGYHDADIEARDIEELIAWWRKTV